MGTTTNVLIVDSDLGFVFWLGQLLIRSGYNVVPARNASDAMTLVDELAEEPDLLIIDGRLPAMAILIRVLRLRNSQLTVVALQSESCHSGEITDGVDHWEPRTSRQDWNAARGWLEVITDLTIQERRYRTGGAS